MPWRTRYRLTASARRSESFLLYASPPMESVCPSITTLVSGLSFSVLTTPSSTVRPSGLTSALLKSKFAPPSVASFVPLAGGGGGGGGAWATGGGAGAGFTGSQITWPRRPPISAPAAMPPPIPAPRSSLDGLRLPLLTAAPPVMPPTVPPMRAPATAHVLHCRSWTLHPVRQDTTATPAATILSSRIAFLPGSVKKEWLGVTESCKLVNGTRATGADTGRSPPGSVGDDVGAPVLRASFLGLVASDRARLAITLGHDPARVDALPDQVALDGLRTPLRELLIVGGAADGIRVAFDGDAELRVVAQ